MKLLRIKILATNIPEERVWYSDYIGKEFDVYQERKYYYTLRDKELNIKTNGIGFPLIHISDCETIKQTDLKLKSSNSLESFIELNNEFFSSDQLKIVWDYANEKFKI